MATQKPLLNATAIHLAYISAIFVIILTAVIVCMSKESISDAAMDNVSFAASIVSIVLAVISIVISVVASFRTYENLGGLQEVETSLLTIVDRLEKLERSSHQTHDDLRAIKMLLQPSTIEERYEDSKEKAEQINRDGSTGKKNVYTPADIQRIQKEAISKVTRDMGITDVITDCKVAGVHDMVFDAIGHRMKITYVIEVKIFRPSLVEKAIEQLYRKIRVMRSVSPGMTRGVLVLISPDTVDKAKIVTSLETYCDRYDNLKIRFYTFDEIGYSDDNAC